MSTAAKRICSALGAGTQAGVWVSLEVAIDAAEKAGVRSIRAHEHLPPTEQLALAMQAAVKELERIGLELGEPAEPT
jgi:hypothetical protein